MASVRVATFNVENLFARFRFRGKPTYRNGKVVGYRPYTRQQLDSILARGWTVEETFFMPFKHTARDVTGDAIKATKADILALQEVESMDGLKKFNTDVLDGRYRQKLAIDGNDPRRIDVGLLCAPKKAAAGAINIRNIRTHQFLRTANNQAFIFSRDCLEVDLQLADGELTLFINHFKSMMEGKAQTEARRVLQVQKVIDIIQDRFSKAGPGNANWVLLGDFNTYRPSAALALLDKLDWAVDVTKRIPDDERWTHFYDPTEWNSGGAPEYRQLDYIWMSKALAAKNPGVPTVIRKGLCLAAKKYTGPRFKGVTGKVAASDHCPVAMDITI
jgi:endonuclease/exonuclease/phosphatase family metal-dependent hydrolase